MAQEAEPFVQQHFRWNFGVNVLDNALYALALSFVSSQTIMPLLVSTLTDSKIAVGLISAIASVMFYLPQLFVANHAEGLKRKLPFVLWVSGLLQRFPYFVIGVSVLIFAPDTPIIALILFFVFLGTGALGSGVVTPAWFTMIGKIIPTHRRGIFFGLSEGGGMLMGIVGAFVVGVTLDQVAYPLNFSVLFFFASILMLFSWLCLLVTREPESTTIKKRLSMRHYFQQLPAILQHHRNYRRFLIAYAFNRLSMMAVGFFIVYSNDNFNLTGTGVGMLTAVLIGSQAVSQLLLGWLGDQLGHKLNLLISAGAIVLTAFLALIASDLATLTLVFIMLGIVLGSDNVSKLSIILEFSAPEDQPTYIGLTNTLLVPVTFLGPIFAGWIATTFGFQMMFMVTILLGMTGGLLFLFWVREPRQTAPQPIASYDKYDN